MSNFRRRLMLAVKAAYEKIKGWFRSDGWYRSDPW